jgi:hypothetical protein
MPLLAPPADPVLAGRTWPDDFPPVNVRSLVLRPRPEDVGVARRFIGDYCNSRGISDTVRYDAQVCGSEVATNLRHAVFPRGRRFAFLQVRQRGPFLSVRLFDPDRMHLPNMCDGSADLDAESGRGLVSIVGQLACRWGFGPSVHGLKVVSFEIDCLPSKGAWPQIKNSQSTINERH